MKKRYYILLLLILLFSIQSYSQRWKLMRYEYIGSAGVSFGQNDLVGVSDYNFDNWFGLEEAFALRNFGLMGNVGFRYRINDKTAIKFSLDGGQFRGSDKKDFGNRKFTTTFIEPSIHYEYALIKESVVGAKYTIMDYRGGISSKAKKNKMSVYVFGGLAGLFYKPNPNDVIQANKTYTIDNSVKKIISIPAGIGAKMAMTTRSSIGAELGGRYTMIPGIVEGGDYIDGFNTKSSKANDIYGFINVFWATKLRTSKSGLPVFKNE